MGPGFTTTALHRRLTPYRHNTTTAIHTLMTTTATVRTSLGFFDIPGSWFRYAGRQAGFAAGVSVLKGLGSSVWDIRRCKRWLTMVYMKNRNAVSRNAMNLPLEA